MRYFREIPGARHRLAAGVLLLLIPGCPALDVSQPIELVPEGDWDTSWTSALERTSSCWNMEFGTLLGVGAGTAEQQVPVRFNDFVCARAAAQVEPAPPVQINICRYYFDSRVPYVNVSSALIFHRVMLHELGHVLNIRFHAEDPESVMSSSDRTFLYRFSAEDYQLFGEANEGFEPRSPCLVNTMSSSRDEIECDCLRLVTVKGPLPAQDLHGAWASGAGTVWAVGKAGTIVLLKGQTWTQVSSGTGADLNAVWGLSGTEIWAVGRAGTILRYDGRLWSAVPSGTTQTLWDVTVDGVHRVLVVGGAGTLLVHEGGTWTASSCGTKRTLYSIHHNTGREVLLAGEKGTMISCNDPPDGSCTVIPTGTTQDLLDIYGTSSSDSLLAVGRGGTLVYYDGTRAHPVSSGTDRALHAIQRAEGYYWVIGEGGTLLQWDLADNSGKTARLRASKTTHTLRDLVDDGKNGLWAVGDGGTVFHLEHTNRYP